MKNCHEVFDENFAVIIEELKKGNFKGCFRLSVDLTVYSTLSEYKEGVLISETLESVFSQVGPIFDEFEVDKDETVQIFTELISAVDDILNKYKKNDIELLNALVSIRFIATKFQMRCWKLNTKKEDNFEEK